MSTDTKITLELSTVDANALHMLLIAGINRDGGQGTYAAVLGGILRQLVAAIEPHDAVEDDGDHYEDGPGTPFGAV